jgi:hypothetical protein
MPSLKLLEPPSKWCTAPVFIRSYVTMASSIAPSAYVPWQALEELGIGRPSTYAPIMSLLQVREKSD